MRICKRGEKLDKKLDKKLPDKMPSFFVWFLRFLGVGGKPLRPHSCLFVGTACLLVDECALTLWQRTKKQQFCALSKLFTLTQNKAI